MSKKYVYVVIGSTGEYSDHDDWYVAAYLNAREAKKHVLLATEAGNARMASIESYHGSRGATPYDKDFHSDYSRGATPYDKDFHSDYSGFNYTYAMIQLHDTAPERKK